MVRLLANPSAVDKKLVAVMGYLDLAPESEHFCLHKEDAENSILANCLSISVPNTPEVLALNHRYVAVWGVVAVGRAGQWGLLDLSIRDVRAIQAVPSQQEMRATAEAQ